MNPPQFTFSEAGHVDPHTRWQFDSGRFTQQERADLVGYHPSNGSVWVGRNTGERFAFEQWRTVSPPDGWQIVAADFTGDGRADVAGYHPSNGTVWVGRNRGSDFEFTLWGRVTPAAGWQFAAGDFWGRARGELVAYNRSDGRVLISENTGRELRFTLWATLDPPTGWRLLTGDFSGDGRTDIAAYHRDLRRLVVGKNQVGRFDIHEYKMGFGGDWQKVSPGADWQFGAGHFTGRFGTDLLCYRPSEGTVWVGASVAESVEWLGTALPEFARFGFSFSKEPSGAVGNDWQFVVDVFDGDLWSDLVGYEPSSGTLWIGKRPKPIEGYCWPLSAAPGEPVSFMLSADGSVNVNFRQYHTSGFAQVGSRTVRASSQEVPANAFRIGCGWVPTFTFGIPATWRSGIYSAWCADGAGNATEIPFVVRPDPAAPSQVAVLANVNTWLAYNGWGGQSKYSGLARTSFLQPMPGAAPSADAEWWHLTRGELWILGWLEAEGYAPHVFSDIDFHEHGCDPQKYKCLILSTHPEYWTPQMYDRLAAYLGSGGSLLYLGANGIFESCEYNAARTGIRFRSGREGGLRHDALFRVLQPPRAERTLLGVATERCSVEGSPYEVLKGDHPLFAGIRGRAGEQAEPGTGLENGALLGTTGLNTGHGNGQASAWEVDTHEGRGALEIPHSSCWMDSPSTPPPSAAPPGSVTILAHGRPEPGADPRFYEDPGDAPGADMTFYEHPGGGIVFSAESITFGGSLVVDRAIQRLIKNVLAAGGVS
jgi:hypothetical protein